MKSGTKIIDIGTRLVTSGIFGYSAFLKFTAAPPAVHIFQRIGMEPGGRYSIAALEIIAIVLLLIPKTAWRGAILGMVIMLCAIGVHIITNEFDVLGDGGLMFASAIVVFFSCISILVYQADMESELSSD